MNSEISVKISELGDAILAVSEEITDLKKLIQCRRSRFEKLTNDWIDGQDVMLALHIGKSTLNALRNLGVLPFSRVKGKYYYKVEDLENLLQTNYSRPKLNVEWK
jgi:hypothetical protein